MLYAECFLSPMTRFHRRRALDVAGLVRCRYGDQVASDRIIAEADVPMGYHLLDLESELQTRVKNLDSALVKQIGEPVGKGEVIARVGKLVKRECVSPVAGKILDARRGKVLIEALPEHVDLTAFYPGKVVNVIPERGAIIETTGVLVQGRWGTGSEVRGRLECVAPHGSMTLTGDMVTAAHMGTILVAGCTADADALAEAVQYQVAAIVMGSVPVDMVPLVEASGLSVIATEGFGDFSINPRAFNLLQTYAGRETCFSPVMQPRFHVRRPEIIIPLPAEGDVPVATHGAALDLGTRVRALRPPYENSVGIVTALPINPHRLESGIRTRGAEVEIEDLGKVFLPFENLEILS